MSLDLTTPDTAKGRQPGPLGRVALDWLFGVDDWISRHRCREAEILGPLRAAEAEIGACWREIEALEDGVLDPTRAMRPIEARLERAEATYRQLAGLRVRLLVTLTSFIYRGEAREPVKISAERPSFYWLLLFEYCTLQDEARGALREFRRHLADVPALVRFLTAYLVGLVLRALATATPLADWGPPDSAARVATAGGDTCLYIPRA